MSRHPREGERTHRGAGVRAGWHRAARLLADHRDVLEGRPGEVDAPAALVARGWASYLLGLDDASLAALEVHGHGATWPSDAPESLVAFATEARAVCRIAALARPGGATRDPRRLETPRKGAQVDAFARLVVTLSTRATRVVDVGSGHGHLTREIAARVSLPVVGLERDVALAGRARALSPLSPLSPSAPSFAVTDVLRDGLMLSPGDCVVGLHACGELGDAMVESVARCGTAIALVGCCLQKRRAASRPPMCDWGDPGASLDLPTALLGLSNLTPRDDGVEATRAENLAARERRLALHRLLTDAVGELRLGAEIEGLNRRAAHRDLGSLVARAFALRGIPMPSPVTIDEAARWASAQHARTRRLSLPRSLLARALEVFVLFDRARYLAEHGLDVAVGVLFPASVSARNLVLLATRGD